MNEIIRMKSVEPVLHGVVKIVWLDGYEAIVDLRPVIASGGIFESCAIRRNASTP